MRRPTPYFPSISFVLSQAQRLKYHQKRYSQQSRAILPPVHDDLMQTVDERDQISYIGLDVASPYIFEQDDRLVSLQEVLATSQVNDPTIKGRRLSISSLVIDLALAVRRMYQQLRVKKDDAEVDSSLSI